MCLGMLTAAILSYFPNLMYIGCLLLFLKKVRCPLHLKLQASVRCLLQFHFCMGCLRCIKVIFLRCNKNAKQFQPRKKISKPNGQIQIYSWCLVLAIRHKIIVISGNNILININIGINRIHSSVHYAVFFFNIMLQ